MPVLTDSRTLLFTPIVGIAFAPLLDSPAVIGTPEAVFVLRPLQPPALTLRFALFAAGRLRAVTLMTQVAVIGTIKLFAAKAFAPGGTLHWANSKNRSCPRRKPSPQRPSKWWNHQQNRRSQNKTKKILCEVDEQKITHPYPVFKPVSLSDFQIGADSLGQFSPSQGQCTQSLEKQ